MYVLVSVLMFSSSVCKKRPRSSDTLEARNKFIAQVLVSKCHFIIKGIRSTWEMVESRTDAKKIENESEMSCGATK